MCPFLLPYILEAIPRYSPDLLWGVPQMKQSIHLNRSPWDWRLSDWLLEDWQVSIIFHRKVAGSPLCDMEACGELLSIFLSVCLSSFFLFFLTPLLFKQASEHLNDQNSATWLSAPALSNSDGYVSASERGRHGRYTYHYTDPYAHTHLPTSPASLLQTGKRLSAYPGVEPGRKVEKCAPQWRCSQSDSCPKPAAICSVRD